MAQINNYFKNIYGDQSEFRAKIKRHRMSIFYRTILVILILAAAGVFLITYNKNLTYSDYTVIKTLEYQESGAASYIKFNNNILKYSTDGISAFNMENEMLWNQTFEMQNPLVDVCDDYVAIGDYKGSKIYVLNSSGLQGQIDTTLPLQNFCVSGNGNVAVVLEEGNVTWVKLFDKKGNNIANDRTTMDKSGYPVSVAISNDGTMLCVSYLVVDSGKISSSVAYYNFGDVGQNEIDNLVSGYNYTGTVMSYVEFMNSKTSFAVGDNKFEIYKGTEKPENIFELGLDKEVKSVFYNEEYIGLVYQEGTSEAPFHIDVYDTSGNLVLEKDFALRYSDILFNKDYLIIYNSDECVIYTFRGKEKFNGNFKESILEMVPTNNVNKYLIVLADRTEEIQLK